MPAPLGKGSKPVNVTGSDGKTYVPDLPVGDAYGVTDVKDWKNLSNDRQLKAFGAYAKANKLPFNLVISPKTESMSEPLLANEPGGMAGGAAMGLVTGVGVAAVQFAARAVKRMALSLRILGMLNPRPARMLLCRQSTELG